MSLEVGDPCVPVRDTQRECQLGKVPLAQREQVSDPLPVVEGPEQTDRLVANELLEDNAERVGPRVATRHAPAPTGHTHGFFS